MTLTSSPAEINLTNCESEPIRFPGAIQPHGALLVLQAESGLIEAASESCLALLGHSAESLLGQPLARLFGQAAAADLLQQPLGGLCPLLPLSLEDKSFFGRCGCHSAGQILLDIEQRDPNAGAIEAMIYHYRRGIENMRDFSDVGEILSAAAQLIRDLTGFDQAMIYRFDTAWNGEVVAESRGEQIESFLGLNFPASDIPKQARELFQQCKVRLIPDVRYAPSALLAKHDARTIDLGLSSLRSVSPIHLAYLRNMGARATLVGALVVEGRLWGLVSCQQKNAPKYFSPAQRDVLGCLFQDISSLIQAGLVHARSEREQRLAQRRRRLVEAIRALDLKQLMRSENNHDLLEVVGADGFALLVDNDITTCGITPQIKRIRELCRRRNEQAPASSLYSSSNLCRDLGVDTVEDGVAGVLFVSVLRRPRVTIIWFRRERRHSVRWAGDPAHPHSVDAAGLPSPRKSFEQFLQDIHGQSIDWSAEELDSALELGSLIEIEALREREAFVQTILDSIPEHICVLDTQGRIVTVNAAWNRFAIANGAPELAKKSGGISYRDICCGSTGKASSAEATAAWAGIEDVLGKQADSFSLDYPCDSATEKRWFRMSVFPMQAPAEGVLVAHEDITQRKQAENLLQQKTAALSHSNSELEQFSYGISHDMRQPLRMISSYLQLLRLSLDEQLDDERREYFHFAIDGALRLDAMLTGLLEFSRVGRKGEPPAWLESRAVIDQVLHYLQPAISDSGACVRLEGNWPQLLASPDEMLRLLQNLLANAVKFRVAGRMPEVLVSSEVVDERWRLRFADNGIGIQPEQIGRLFQVFQRLQSRADFDGTGIGLALCRKIVERHHGRIWVESLGHGMGSTFQFEMPLDATQAVGE